MMARCKYYLSLLLLICVAVSSGVATANKKIILNVGEDYTFDCFPPIDNDSLTYNWVRALPHENEQPITAFITPSLELYQLSTFRGSTRVTSRYVYVNETNHSFSLTVLNMSVADSGNYSCGLFINDKSVLQNYETLVIGCSCTADHGPDSGGYNITCTLENHSTSDTNTVVFSIDGTGGQGLIKYNTLTFLTDYNLQQDVKILFNPLPDFKRGVSCIVPAPPIPVSKAAMVTATKRTTRVVSTTSTMSTEGGVQPITPLQEIPQVPKATTIKRTTSVISTTSTDGGEQPTNRLITSPPTVRDGIPIKSSISVPTASILDAPDPKASDKPVKLSGQNLIIVIICAVGSCLILLLIVVIVLIKSRRQYDHKAGGSTPGETEARAATVAVEESEFNCYAGVHDTLNLAGSDGAGGVNPLIDKPYKGHSLCTYVCADGDDRVKNLEGGAEGHQDLDDSRFTSDHMTDNDLYDWNSDLNARPTTLGSPTEACAPLYAMPDKRSKSDNTSRRDACNTEEVKQRDVSALYAQVDRSSKVTKNTPVDVSALYAVVDKRDKKN